MSFVPYVLKIIIVSPLTLIVKKNMEGHLKEKGTRVKVVLTKTPNVTYHSVMANFRTSELPDFGV